MGKQAIAVHFVTPRPVSEEVGAAAAAASRPVIDLGDPLAIVQLVASALQHDSAVAAEQRVSAAGLELAAHPAAAAVVYYGLSAPTQLPPWAGNLRKYWLAPSDDPLEAPPILGRDLAPVFDGATGRMAARSWSLWSDRPDGAAVDAGGAAARLPGPVERRVYLPRSGRA